ncbi:hypothetical protein B0O99DRAFT_685782 [Bisporella sp. PMI_857]|nr:hypothetical protein B0O99DRAFT_685782 [Bisporella sp. PMI_857]
MANSRGLPIVIEDLRNRHQRRCIAKIGQHRLSRRKACARCVSSKLKCDLSLPACKRCRVRKPFTPCVYPQDSSEGASKLSNNANKDSGDLQIISCGTTIALNTPPTTDEDCGDGAMEVAPDPTLKDMTVPGAIISSASLGHETSFASSPANNSVYSFENYYDLLNSQWPMPACVGDQIDLQQLLALSSNAFAPNTIFDHQLPLLSHPNTHNMQIPQINMQPFASDRDHPSIEGAFNNAGAINNWPDMSNRDASLIPTALVAGDWQGDGIQDSISLNPGEHGKTTTRILDVMGLERMLEILRSYPIKMLQKDYYPPFLHHSLYRCSAGGLNECIAIALCCVSAATMITEKSASFVFNLINLQRENIVADFHARITFKERLSGLHAVHLYQMLGLLFSKQCSIARQHIREAEMSHSSFLKIVRWITREYLKENQSLSIDQEDWKTWYEAETLRRTLLLVHATNFLGICFDRSNMFYYEPLDDDLINSLWLPAPDVMWKADGEEAWKEAKEMVNYGTWEQITLMSLAERFQREDCVIFQGLAQRFEDLPELTKLILGCKAIKTRADR